MNPTTLPISETAEVLAPSLPPQAALDQALALLEAGGPVMLVLLGLSVIALTIILLKLWQFATLRVGSRRFADEALEHWRAGRRAEALKRLAGVRNPIARVLETAIRGLAQRQVGEDKVREEVARIAAAQLENLRSHLRGLEVIATLSPLLGLLGTVLGMIEAFQQLEQAGRQVDPTVLSGGIWEALLTTAAGLSVAVPAVIVLNGLERTIERLSHRMEDAVTQIFTKDLAFRETLEPTPSGTPQADHAF